MLRAATADGTGEPGMLLDAAGTIACGGRGRCACSKCARRKRRRGGQEFLRGARLGGKLLA